MSSSNAHGSQVMTRMRIFTDLKQQQNAINMQIRLAMQIHDTQTQKELEKEMEKVTKEIKDISVQK